MRVIPGRGWRRRSLVVSLAALTVVATFAVAGPAAAEDGGTSDAPILGTWEVQSLNGVNNNPFVPNAGSVGINYLRIGNARYADGRSQMVTGPNVRNVSNRVFNDINVNVFSERGVTQFGTAWGQFLDHDIDQTLTGTTSGPPPAAATEGPPAASFPKSGRTEAIFTS